MEEKRSPLGASPSDAPPRNLVQVLEVLEQKPGAGMGASPCPDPQLRTRSSKASTTRTKSASGKSRKKTTKSPKGGREKQDQKETDAAGVPVAKQLEQPAGSVDTKAAVASDSQRDKPDRKEEGAAEASPVKLPEQPAEPGENKAPERPEAKEADRMQLNQVAVPPEASKRKQLSKKRRISIFTEFMEKLHTTGRGKDEMKPVTKKAAESPPKQQRTQELDNKALQELLQDAPYKAVTPALLTNTNICTRAHYIAGALLLVVLVALCVVVYLLSMRSPRVCDTRVCRHYAKLLHDTLSHAVPPCADFHAHVCAGWERTHRISVIDNVYEHVIQRVVQDVSTTATRPQGQTAVQKAATFFQSCRGIYTGRRSELELIKKRLLDFGIYWPEMTNKSSVLEIIASTAAAWNLGPLIHLSTWQPGRLTIAPALYFNSTLQRRQVMLGQSKSDNAYQKYFNKMVQAFGRAQGNVPSYKEFVDIESIVLPAITKPYNAVPWNTVKDVGLKELKAVAMGSIANETWEQELHRRFNTTSSGDYVFTIINVDFLKAFFESMKSQGEPKMAYYLGWTVAQQASLLSNAELINYFYLTEGDATVGHLRFCVYLSHIYMGLPFYAGYMRTLFTPHVFQDVSALAKTVRKSLRARLEEVLPALNNSDSVLPVLDGNDQAYVSAALSLFTDAEDGHLNKLYERFPDMTPSTVTNMELITRARRMTTTSTEMERFHDMEGSRLYYLQGHELRLLPSSLEFPVYHPQAPSSIKYSTLGGQVTDALVQLLYNAAPSFGNSTIFKQQCIINQDGAVESATLMSTLRVTSLSMLYDLFVEMSKGAARLPLDIYRVVAEGQLFFIMWCYMHCGSPNANTKCNAPLKVLDRFHRAFGCKRGQPMYPKSDCSL